MGGAEQGERLSDAVAGAARGPSSGACVGDAAWGTALRQSLDALWASGYEDRIIAELAVGAIARAVGVRAALILGYRASNDSFELLAGIGAQESAVDALISGPGRSVPLRAAREARWQIVRGAVSVAAVPIEHESGVPGVIMLFSAKPEAFSDEILCNAQDALVVCGDPIVRLMAARMREVLPEELPAAVEGGPAVEEAPAAAAAGGPAADAAAESQDRHGLAERVDQLLEVVRERTEAAGALERRVAELEAAAREVERLRESAAEAPESGGAGSVALAEAARAQAESELSCLRQEVEALRERNAALDAERQAGERRLGEILATAEIEAAKLADARAEAEHFKSECEEFRAECERLEGILAREVAAQEELVEVRARLEGESRVREAAAREHAARIAELETERDGLIRRVAEVVREGEINAARLGERIAELESTRHIDAGDGESVGAMLEELESRMAEIIGDTLEVESLRATLQESQAEQESLESEISDVFSELANLRGVLLEKALGEERAAPPAKVALPAAASAPEPARRGSAGVVGGDPFEGGFSDPELLEAFSIEARDCIRMTEVLMASLEQQPQDVDVREAILRGFLTLESAAAAVGLKTLERQMHQGNRLLELVELGRLKMDGAVVRLLARLNECAGALVDAALRREGGAGAAVADVGEEIAALCSSLEAAPAPRKGGHGAGSEASKEPAPTAREKHRRTALRA